METQSANLNKEAIKYGVFFGLFNVVLFLIVYLIDFTLFVSFKLDLLSIVIAIGALIFFSRTFRKLNGGFITFNKLFQLLFISYILSIFLGTVFTVILNTVIDPELPEHLKKTVMDNTYQWMHDWNVPDAKIDETMAEMEKQDFSPSFKNTTLQTFYGILFAAVMCLIFAAIYKKKNKEADYEALLANESNQSS